MIYGRKEPMSVQKFGCIMLGVVGGAVGVFLAFLGSFTAVPDPIHHDFIWQGEYSQYNVFCTAGGRQVGLVQQEGWGNDNAPWRAYYDWQPTGDYIDRSHAEEAVEEQINKFGVCDGQ